MSIRNKLSQNIQSLKCVLSKHITPPPKSAISISGAVFEGGICANCKKILQGKFISDMWDDTLTEEREINGTPVVFLTGTNKKLKEEGWIIVYDF